MTRVTPKDVRKAVDRLEVLLRNAGLLADDATLTYSEGSQTYGRAHRLHWSPAGTSGLHTLACIDDYLGWTAAEALAVIETATHLLRTIERLKEGDEWITRNIHEGSAVRLTDRKGLRVS